MIPCRPSPCGWLSQPRTTTAAPLPYRIFNVISLGVTLETYHPTALHIAGLLRRFGLGNPRLDNWKWLVVMSEWVFVRCRLLRLAVAGITQAGSTCPRLPQHTANTTILRRRLKYAALDCPSSSLALFLVHNLSSHRSAVA